MNKERDILLGEFENLLRGEAGFYVSLMEQARLEQHALVKNNIKEIESATHDIENTTVELRKSESARTACFQKLKQFFPSVKKEFTLTNLIDAVDEPFRSRFKALQKEMTALMKEVHYLNEYNASLVKHSLEYTNYLLSLFTGSPAHSDVYTSSGTLNKGGNTKLIDSQA